MRKAKGLGRMSPINLILPVFMKVKRTCVFSFSLELWESHVQNKQFLENCTAADNLPLKNSACSEAAHTLLLNGFNLGCSMKRTTLSSDASNSGEALEVVLVSFLLSLGFFIDILTVWGECTHIHTHLSLSVFFYVCYSKYASSFITEPKALTELGLFGLSWVLYAVIDPDNVSVTGENPLDCLVSFRRQFCWKTIPNELQIEMS